MALLCKWLGDKLRATEAIRVVVVRGWRLSVRNPRIVLYLGRVGILEWLFSEDLGHEALELLAWTMTEGNRFFHLLYSVGVWLPVHLAREASACGWNAVESCLHVRGN